jgi:hypothetical protein
MSKPPTTANGIEDLSSTPKMAAKIAYQKMNSHGYPRGSTEYVPRTCPL